MLSQKRDNFRTYYSKSSSDHSCRWVTEHDVFVFAWACEKCCHKALMLYKDLHSHLFPPKGTHSTHKEGSSHLPPAEGSGVFSSHCVLRSSYALQPYSWRKWIPFSYFISGTLASHPVWVLVCISSYIYRTRRHHDFIRFRPQQRHSQTNLSVALVPSNGPNVPDVFCNCSLIQWIWNQWGLVVTAERALALHSVSFHPSPLPHLCIHRAALVPPSTTNTEFQL